MPLLIPVAAAFAVGAASAGAAGATFLGLTGLAAAAAIGGIDAALTLGSELLMTALTPTPKNPGQQLSVSLNPSQPRTVALGQCATAGSLVTFQTWGDNNSNIILVFAVADHKCQALVGGWWMGERMQINADGSVEQCKHKDKYYMWVRFYPGDWNDQIDPTQLLANCSGEPLECAGAWGRGVCQSRGARLAINAGGASARYRGALINSSGRSREPPLYDRRQDGSVGGSGSQRWDRPGDLGVTAQNGAVADREHAARLRRGEYRSADRLTRTRDTFFGLNLADAGPALRGERGGDERLRRTRRPAELWSRAGTQAAKWKDTSILAYLCGRLAKRRHDHRSAPMLRTVEEIVVSFVFDHCLIERQGHRRLSRSDLASAAAVRSRRPAKQVDWRATATDSTVAVPRYADRTGIISCEQDAQTAVLQHAAGGLRERTVADWLWPAVCNPAWGGKDDRTRVQTEPRGPTITDKDLRLDGPHQVQAIRPA